MQCLESMQRTISKGANGWAYNECGLDAYAEAWHGALLRLGCCEPWDHSLTIEDIQPVLGMRLNLPPAESLHQKLNASLTAAEDI